MVFIWGWGGNRRRRGPGYGPGYGPGPGWGGRGGWGGPPPGYGRRGYGGGGGGGSCLRDLLFLDAGCCLAESLSDGCLLALGPALLHAHRTPVLERRGVAGRMIAAVRFYQREISPRRPAVCHFTPTCSAYAVEALETHGARRGAWLTARRLLRCRPGAVRRADPVPAAA